VLHRLWDGLAIRPTRTPRRRTAATGSAPLEAARAYERLAEIHYFASDRIALLNSILHTANLAEEAGLSPELARAYSNMCLAVGLVPLPRLAEVYGRRALATANEVGQLAAQAWVLQLIGLYSAGVGNWARAGEALEQAGALFDRLGDAPHRGECWGLLGHVNYLQGNFARGGEFWARVHTTASRRDDTLQQAWGLSWCGQGSLLLGRTAEAIPALQAAVTRLRDNPDRTTELAAYGLLAMAHWRRGERGLAEQAARAAAD